MPKGQSLLERFNDRYEINELTECWEWTGTVDVENYGVIWTRERNNNERAHRVSLKLSGVVVPDDKMVLHQCDNPCCVNPSHLTVGDNYQNQIESRDRGRATQVPTKRILYYQTMSSSDFNEWKKRFIGKSGKQISNLKFAERVRNENTHTV